jgi:hypothetical protein
MNAPGISIMDAEFHNSSAVLSSFAVSVFVLGFSVLIPKQYTSSFWAFFSPPELVR